MRRRLLMVGRTRYRLPLERGLEKKFEALGRHFDMRVVASGRDREARGDATFSLQRPWGVRAIDGPRFYATLPVRVAREIRRLRPDAIVAQSPYEGLAALVGRRLAGGKRCPRIIVEIHGDWRTFARLYGGASRRLIAPLADRCATEAVRRADGVRTLSGFTTGLVRSMGVEPSGVFTTYTELTAFSGPPPVSLPERPTAISIGVLEPYKNVDGIVAAWRLAAPRVPGALLRLVGDGPSHGLVECLVADLPGQTDWVRRLTTPDVVAALDDSWTLLLPSRSEGTPRVVLEALCRGRAVVGGRVGGIPDVVVDGVTGLLVDPEEPSQIAEALVRVLSDRSLAERFGAQGHDLSSDWTYTADEYAARMRAMVERVLSS